MKNSIIVLIVFGLGTWSSCMPKVDLAKEWAGIDSVARVALTHFTDSLKTDCENNVMLAAHMRADSLWKAASAKGAKPKPKPVSAPVETKTTSNQNAVTGTKGETGKNQVVGTKGDTTNKNKVIGTKGKPK